jgi:hypothetical protein
MHLSPEELIDLAEGARPASSAPHLATCETCRLQLADLRAVMATLDVDVPEPSPLFWDHLSARVRERVAVEATRKPGRFGFGPWSWRIAAAMSAAAVVVAVSVTLTLAPSTRRVVATVADAPAGDAGFTATGDDPSFSLLGDLAGNLDWDAAAQAGISMDVGSADTAVAELNDAERSELQRLLRAAMSGSGV